MLSDLAATTHLNRPRPPGSRRSSANKVLKVEEAYQDEHNENDPFLLKSSPRRASTSYTKQMEMERDLELDLPQDFAAVFQRKPRFWPKTRKSTTPSASKRNEEAARLGGSLGRSNGRRVSPFDNPHSPGREGLDSLFHPTTDDLHSISPVNASDDEEHGPQSMDFEAESEHSMDSEWVGDLPREELETLLMQANRVIKDRERDLGIAAAVGKALLEKNISLRDKHEGIMGRLSSVNSFSQFTTTDEEDASPQTLPCYSPPDGGEQRTPMPAALVKGYFETPPDEAASPQEDAMQSSNEQNGSKAPLPTYWTAANSVKRESWNLPQDYFVPSVPPSPASSRYHASQDQSHSQGQLQFSNETQRQLDMLSEQNEALLEQLSDLQMEAEEAKKSGGKKLKKLNREIDGLRTELEAATERNFELERVAADEGNRGSGDDDSSGRVRKGWRRRGTGHQGSSDEANTSLQSSSTVRGSDETMPEVGDDIIPPPQSTTEAESDAGSVFPRSESSLSTATQSKVISEPERALVAQLMSKIRELEETNAILALAGTEMDGRIGKAMEEGERIRDAYEAVENVAAFEESQMKRDDSDLLETHFTGSPYSSVSISPSSIRNRRAPGNRYHIEGRRTIRAALKMEQDQDEYYYDSSNSSLAPSPVKGRGPRRSLRPRILITPSSEDLRGSARRASVAGWEDVEAEDNSRGDNIMSSTPMKPQFKHMYHEGGAEGDFPSLQSFDSMASMAYHGRKSLGSELGSIFGGEDSTSLTPVIRRQSSHDEPLRWTDLQRSGSSGTINLRSRASINSLRAPSEAASDIADLKWSVSSDATIQGEDSSVAGVAPWQEVDETVRELAVIKTGNASPSMIDDDEDGNWYSANNDDFVPRGCLQNELESTHDSYEWIEKVTKKMPLHWADDDDFGKPITERDARQLGLLEGPAPKSQPKPKGLLAWVQRKAPRQGDEKGKMRAASQIESREQVDERERLSDLLREKRVVALQKRVLSGQISTGRAREMGVEVDQVQRRRIKQYGETSLEEEVTQRAIAYSTARSRRVRAGRPVEGVARKRKDDNKETQSSSEEDFELLDLDPSKRKPGQRGTDYYPITLKERYQPTMVKQRAKHFSGEAITWASAWATFSLVMVFAFLVTFSRGPKRVLNGQSHRSKR